jgi:tricorn protease
MDKVAKASGGRVGYVHIPDMGVPGPNEFAKHFSPQTDSEAMVAGVRSNGGGNNVSRMIVERLRRELVLVDIARNRTPRTNPGTMILGPKVLLADEFSASDGDLVTCRLKTYKIGPGTGKRTWSGVVGVVPPHARPRRAEPARVLPIRRHRLEPGDRRGRRRAGPLRRQ